MSEEQLQTVEYMEKQQPQIVHTVKPTSTIPLCIIFPQVFPLILKTFPNKQCITVTNASFLQEYYYNINHSEF